jgi:hypothetical protein
MARVKILHQHVESFICIFVKKKKPAENLMEGKNVADGLANFGW